MSGGKWNRSGRRSGGDRPVKILVPVGPPKNFIVKVQVSTDRKSILVYNEDRSINWQGEAEPSLLELMGDNAKGFFRASIGSDMKIAIDGPASWQDW